MVQNIVTLIIVYLTAAWAIYSVYTNVKYKKGSKCASCSGSCGLKDLKIKEKSLPVVHIKYKKAS